MSVVQQASRLAGGGQVRQAVDLLAGAGRGGDADALLELAVWYLSGQIVRRDLAQSRHFFRLAGEAGNGQAAMIHLSFLAIGVGGDRDWRGAVQLLEALATHDPVAATQFGLLKRMALDGKGDPSTPARPKELSASPYAAAFRGLLSPDEANYLIALAEPLLEPSLVVDPETGQMRPHPVRTSHAAALGWVDENPVVHAINRRIAAATGTIVEAGEPLQLLRYAPGQEYRPHHDAIPGATNQRLLTLLIYLNEEYEGGATVFPRSGLSFRGKVGDALLFRNALPDGRIDPEAVHAGSAVTSGRKYLATRWIHQRQFMDLR
jgi:prolyl 4-hydroxylase